MDISYYKKYEPIFGEWSIVREIGEGSFGKVFEIERRDFGYTYKAALKAITIPQSRSEIERIADDGMGPESVTAYFRGFVQELVEEFRIMSKLKGESNIVSYEDHRVIEHTDEIGWDVFIRMELLTPLTKYAKEHGISRADVIRLGIDICSALELCRKNNIIHRDIKPENIFVSENGKFKLGDFGIAKTVEKTTGGLSKKGTYTYMAPEVYKGEAYGASVDIYSLGIVLYRFMNNNRTPFLPSYPTPIKYADRESAMNRRMDGETIPAPANADEALSRVILKACAYKPEERYRSAADMRHDLEALLGEDEQQPDLDKTVGVFSGTGTAKVDAPAAAPNATEEAEALAETDSSNIKVPLAATEVGTVGVFSAYGSADGPLFMDEVPVQLPTVVESDEADFGNSGASENAEETEDTVPASAVYSEATERIEQRPSSPHTEPNGGTKQTDSQQKQRKKTPAIIAAILVAAIVIGIAAFSNMGNSESDGSDVAAETPEPGWSEWTSELPAGVTEDGYVIEQATRYRSRSLETTTSSSSSLAGWEPLGAGHERGSYGSWSSWSTSPAYASDSRKVETKTQYSYRTKSTTSSSSSSLNGWVLYDTKESYGSWSDWSDSYISSSSNRQVDTRQVKTGARYLVAHYCTGNTGDDNKYKSANWKFDSRCSYHELGWYDGEKSLGTQVDGETCSNTCWKYFVMDTEEIYKTQYRSRSIVTTYYYYKWSDWSSYSDTYQSSSSTKEVRTRTAYRYCDRSQVPTYHFQRWGDWSNWTTQKISPSSTVQVETGTFYRYKEK